MKPMYYRPQKVSSISLLCLAALSIIVVAVLQRLPGRFDALDAWVGRLVSMPDMGTRMTAASRQAESAFATVRERRVELKHKMFKAIDPARTGMLGPSMSLVTTLPGHLDAKQTSVNPNFAAVATRLLVESGARPGDRVAIGCTGSFPALNIAVYAAAEALELRPTIVSSAASSQYGANAPDLMWPEMEMLLYEKGKIGFRSSFVSRGGFRDRAADMTDETRKILEASIQRSGIELMDSKDDLDAIDRRMQVYAAAAEDEPYAAYVNVGGGASSVGGTKGNEALGSGLIQPNQLKAVQDRYKGKNAIDCVATRFLGAGVPVVNMINSVTMAKRYGLPVASTEPIEVGQGGVYSIADPRRLIALLGILIICGSTAVVLRPPVFLVEKLKQRGLFGTEAVNQPQWMV